MPLRDNISGRARRLSLLSMFLAYALVIGLLERMIPVGALVPGVPGVRLGLANVVVLAALYIFPASQALVLMLLKCVLTALISGSAASLAYSLTGSSLAFLGMLLLIKLAGEKFSPAGVSAFGAVLHNIGQLLTASALMGTFAVFVFLPQLLIAGVITGVLTGLAVKWVLKFLPTNPTPRK
jgi:heptaprenyl diphosphate synthase